MGRRMLTTLVVTTVLLWSFAQAQAQAQETGEDLIEEVSQEAAEEMETSDALEELLSPEEMAMEFGPASRLEESGFVPWEEYTDDVSKVHSARFDRTQDLSGLEVTPDDRITSLMPEHLEPYFDLVLYISKAESGPLAQQIFIYERGEAGSLELTDRWLVSTGREAQEQYFTTTPSGFFMLDPHRFIRRAYSAQWNGSSMPNAMFFNYSYRDRMSGYAIHGILPNYNRYLGRRASGGCVRLSYDHSTALFNRVQGHYQGNVPIFAFDEAGGTTFRDGTVEYDENGQIRTEWGYRVLLIVDTFAG